MINYSSAMDGLFCNRKGTRPGPRPDESVRDRAEQTAPIQREGAPAPLFSGAADELGLIDHSQG